MGIDLERLTPAPWWVLVEDDHIAERDSIPIANVLIGDQEDRVCQLNVGECEPKVNAEFIALARNAFDVSAKRGWGYRLDVIQEHHSYRSWVVIGPLSERVPLEHKTDRSNPLLALVKAEKWFVANIEQPA